MKQIKNLVWLMLAMGLILSCDDKEVTPTKPEDTIPIVTDASQSNSITGFEFKNFEPAVVAIINETDGIITATVPYGTNLTALIPTVTISEGAALSPEAGTPVNFTNDAFYWVTSESGTTKKYQVRVVVAKNSDNTLSNFSIYSPNINADAVIDQEQNTITATVPFKTDVTALKASYELPEGAFISPDPLNNNIDFTEAVVFTVTAENGDAREYTATIIVEAAPAPIITSVNQTTLEQGQILVVGVENFATDWVNNKVYFVQNGTETEVKYSTSEGEISIIIPFDFGLGEYDLKLVSYDQSTVYGTKINIIATTRPVMHSINKTTFSRGEVIEITGLNFGSYGSLGFVPAEGGDILVMGVTVTNGTAVSFTIPNDFPLGTYYLFYQTSTAVPSLNDYLITIE